MPRFTKRFIDSAKLPAGAKMKHFYDEDLPGFVLTLKRTKTGRVTKRFSVRYSPKNAPRRWMPIGSYGVLTVDQARDLARAALAQAAVAKVMRTPDPVLAKKLSPEVPTFAKWAETYMKEARRRTKRPDQIEFHLNRAASAFGTVRLDEITQAMIQRTFEQIGEAAPISANRWLRTTSACFQRAAEVAPPHIRANPCKGIKLNRKNPGRRRILSADEVSRLYAALANEPDIFVRAAVALAFETGARMGEVLNAAWRDFDLEGLTWHLPDPKAGEPQEKEITAHTGAWLKAVPRYGAFVIFGRDPKKPRADLKGGWARVTKAAGIVGAHAHDLRRTVSDLITRSKGIHAAARVLGHSAAGNVTASHYQGETPGERRAALDEVIIPLVSRVIPPS